MALHRPAAGSLLTTPPELLLTIADTLPYASIFSLQAVNRKFYALFNHYLYRRSINASDAPSFLAYASAGGFLSTVVALIRAGASVSAVNPDSDLARTPLQAAVLGREKNQRHTALEYNGRRSDAETVEGREAVIRFLLKKGADAMATDKQGNTVIHLASQATAPVSVPTIQLLICGGAPLKQWNYRRFTPMNWAAYHACIPTLRALLLAGADISPTHTWVRYTPLHFAAEYDNTELCDLLLSPEFREKSNINAIGTLARTPLMIAALHGSSLVARQLIATGADCTASDEWGYTALHYAILEMLANHERYSTMTPEFLQTHRNLILSLAARVDPNACGTDGTVLHLWAASALTDRDDLVSVLLKHGADPNATFKDGRTPLHHLLLSWLPSRVLRVDHSIPARLQLLLAGGADANAVMKAGRSPLHLVCAKRSNSSIIAQAVRTLVASGARLDATDEQGSTPLHVAAEYGNTEAIRELCKAGAMLNARNNAGRTPLMEATKSQRPEAVEVLLEEAELNIESVGQRRSGSVAGVVATEDAYA